MKLSNQLLFFIGSCFAVTAFAGTNYTFYVKNYAHQSAKFALVSDYCTNQGHTFNFTVNGYNSTYGKHTIIWHTNAAFGTKCYVNNSWVLFGVESSQKGYGTVKLLQTHEYDNDPQLLYYGGKIGSSLMVTVIQIGNSESDHYNILITSLKPTL